MDSSEFNSRVDETFESLEMALDETDVDYEHSAGILTVEFENDTSLIFSRQSANSQLWLAARSGGYHFAWDDAEQDWRCTRSGNLLRPFTVAQMLEQGGLHLVWD